MKTTRRSPRVQRGFMLLEVMIALLIFSLGVLGIVGLQASMTKAQTGSKFRADASFLAQRLVGNMWADRSGLDRYDTTIGCASNARCSDWLAEVARQLPDGDATVSVSNAVADATGRVIAADVTITINWTPPNEEQRQYVTSSSVSTNL